MSVCMVLSPAKADGFYLPGNRRLLLQKPLFTGEAPVFTYKTLTASLDFLRLNLEMEISHTRAHKRAYTHESAVRHASESRLLPTDRSCPLWLFFLTVPLGHRRPRPKAERHSQ